MNRRQFFKRAAIVAAGAAAAPLVGKAPEATEAVAEVAAWPPEDLSEMLWSVNGQNVAHNARLGSNERAYARGVALKLYRLTLPPA